MKGGLEKINRISIRINGEINATRGIVYWNWSNESARNLRGIQRSTTVPCQNERRTMKMMMGLRDWLTQISLTICHALTVFLLDRYET
jgi:hypothetical protein